MPERILITGERGFIGSFLSRRLGSAAHPSLFNLFDIPAIQKRILELKPEVVIHLAGMSAVHACESNKEMAMKVNYEGTLNLLSALGNLEQKPHFIFFSTAMVYDFMGHPGEPISEDHPTHPLNHYAKTKLEAEREMIRYSLKHSLPVTILRIFNHIHHTQKQPAFLNSIYQALVNQVGLVGEQNILTGNLELKRDMGSVFDLMDAVVAVLRNPPQASYQILNVCNGKERRLRDLAILLVEQMNARCHFEYDPNRVRGDEPIVVLGSHSKISHLTGWQPTVQSDLDLIRAFLAPLE